MNAYNPTFLWWFAVVCGDLWWFGRFLTAHGHTDVFVIIVPNSGGDLWWFAVVCGGLGGLW